jgi:Ni,Fe-hydrogenase III large subunit
VPTEIDDSGDKFAQLAIRRQNRRTSMNLLILVVDDEPDVEAMFRQQFRRDLRTRRFTLEFTQSPRLHFDARKEVTGAEAQR